MVLTQAQLARDLRELIAAIDHRLPRVAQAGEAAIARDAAELRAKAIARLAILETELGRSVRDGFNV